MTPDPWKAHGWPRVLERLGEARHPEGRPLGALAYRLSRSVYVVGLHPVMPMSTLRLYASELYDPDDDVITVDVEDGDFVEHYRARPVQPAHASLATRTSWRRRGPDGFALVRRCVDQLGWVIRYAESE